MELPFGDGIRISHWNPGATAPLEIPVCVVCNTQDEIIDANIRANSRLSKQWQRLVPAHDGVAILCGSGPSLADGIHEIEQWEHRATLFALNGAANFLSANDILPDYQVLLDARSQTADLIGPAKAHLFASQVSPVCFERVPDAKLWHMQVSGIDELIPPYEESYCLIGGAASVGNTATCLAYAMGFRDLHCYGYDSSHRDGRGHAFPQPMNDHDPHAFVDWNGKRYISSVTMRLQAEKFITTSAALKEAGCAITVHGTGLLPDIYNSLQSFALN